MATIARAGVIVALILIQYGFFVIIYVCDPDTYLNNLNIIFFKILIFMACKPWKVLIN